MNHVMADQRTHSEVVRLRAEDDTLTVDARTQIAAGRLSPSPGDPGTVVERPSHKYLCAISMDSRPRSSHRIQMAVRSSESQPSPSARPQSSPGLQCRRISPVLAVRVLATPSMTSAPCCTSTSRIPVCERCRSASGSSSIGRAFCQTRVPSSCSETGERPVDIPARSDRGTRSAKHAARGIRRTSALGGAEARWTQAGTTAPQPR
jgi:hypothetical protein